VGLEDIIRRRLGRRTMGFGQMASQKDESSLGETLRQVASEDILQFGMIPEFVGRLPVTVALGPLDEEGLMSALTEPKNALIKQYKSLFEMENCNLEFTPAALRAIARRAMEKGTGARGLRSIVEESMLDIMYELPDQEQGTTYVIDEHIIDGRSRLFHIPQPQAKSA
jgi:ATP-dependent Clp protease ATP-binding subunit ClpX